MSDLNENPPDDDPPFVFPSISKMAGGGLACVLIEDVWRGYGGTRTLGPGCDPREAIVEVIDDDDFLNAVHARIDEEIDRLRAGARQLRREDLQ